MATNKLLNKESLNGVFAEIKRELDNIPQSVTDLEDAEDYATKEYTDARTIGEVTATVEVGGETKQATVTKDGANVNIDFPNLQGPKGDPLTWDDLTPIQKASLKGDPGDNCYVGQGDLPLAQVVSQATDKAITPKAVQDALTYYQDIDFSGIADINYFIANDTGKWNATGSTQNKCKIVPVKEGSTIQLLPRSGAGQRYAILTSNVTTIGTSTLADGYDLPANTNYGDGVQTIVVPTGGKYLYLLTSNAGSERIPSLLRYVNGTLKESLAEEVQKTEGLVFSEIDVPVLDYGYSNGGMYNSTASYKHAAIPVKEGEIYKVGNTGANNGITIVGFITYKRVKAGGAIPFVAGTTEETVSAADVEKVFTIPSGCNYLFIYNAGGGQVFNVKKAFANSDENLPVKDIRRSLGKHAKYVPTYTDIIPDANDVLNARYAPGSSPNNVFVQDDSGSDKYTQKLIWTPKVQVVGGEILTMHLSGSYSVNLFEWPYKDVDIPPQDIAFKESEKISRTNFSASTTDVAVELKPSTRRITLYVHFNVNVSPEDITDAIISINAPVATDDDWTFGDDEEQGGQVGLVKEAHWTPNDVNLLGLLHYSDIHCSTSAAEQLKRAVAKYRDYIDDVLNTGDVVYENLYTEGTDNDKKYGVGWWKASGLADMSLMTIGNHDCSTTTNGMDKSMEWCHDTYFADYIPKLGYVMPDGYDDSESPNYKATYWHKDYSTQKVRLICIDAIHHFDGILDPSTGEIISQGFEVQSNAQELWLIEKLNETLAGSGNSAEGYSVIIASHFFLDDYGVSVEGSSDNKTWNDNSHTFDVNKNADGGRLIDKDTANVVNFHNYTNSNYKTNTTYHMRNRTSARVPESIAYDTKGNVNNIGDIIKYWMENNFTQVVSTTGKTPVMEGWYYLDGNEYKLTSDTTPAAGRTYYTGAKLIAFLAGHTHQDLMFYPKDYPNVLNIVAPKAGDMRTESIYNREAESLTANIVLVDTYNHLIKLVRVGNSNRYYLRPINYLCYNYATREVISQG